MRRILLTTIIGLGASFGVLLAAGAEDEVRKAEKDWAAAVVARDYDALTQILGDQLVYAHSTGVVESKSEYLGKLRSGAQRYDGIEHSSTIVRAYANAAVAHSKVRMRGQSGSEAFDNQLMMMHLWVKQGGKWRLAAHQTTKLE
jgi:ketosteroid isomerase-like protein